MTSWLSFEPFPDPAQPGGQSIELLESGFRDALQSLCATLGETEAHDAAIARVRYASDQAAPGSAGDELGRGIGFDEEVLSNFADGRSAVVIGMPAHREQQLVLGRSESRGGRLVPAPLQESAESGTELQEPLVVRVT